MDSHDHHYGKATINNGRHALSALIKIVAAETLSLIALPRLATLIKPFQVKKGGHVVAGDEVLVHFMLFQSSMRIWSAASIRIMTKRGNSRSNITYNVSDIVAACPGDSGHQFSIKTVTQTQPCHPSSNILSQLFLVSPLFPERLIHRSLCVFH